MGNAPSSGSVDGPAATADARVAADAAALRRVLAVRPEVCGLERAGTHLGMRDRELLHAGPPLEDPTSPCTPILHAAIAAALLEGWARHADDARQQVREGRIHLRPAQDAGCVVPLADVLSPSMWAQVVRDAASPERRACSPLHAGATQAMRVGAWDAGVVARLRWLDATLAPAYGAALADAIPLIDLADQALAQGDDGHGKTAAASAALAALLHDRLAGPDAPACRAFLASSPGFFLNLWMAASRCMLSAAAGTPGASVVTAAGGNGTHFGIQVAALPGRWFTAAAQAPVIPGATPAQAAASLGAIGDSAIVDLLGFGAMATLDGVAQAAPGFAALWPDETVTPRALLAAAHPAFARTRARVAVCARDVVRSGRRPIVSLGVLDKAGMQGRLGGGFYRAPLDVFAAAQAASDGGTRP